MNVYSHLVLADRLAPYLNLNNPAEYYLGAMIPDVRYYSRLKRTQTHISTEKIVTYAEKYPHLQSFVAGYLVHCLIDKSDLPEILWQRPLLGHLQRRVPAKLAPVLIEFYYIETTKLNLQLSTASNEMLDDLQVDPAHVTAMAEQINTFLADPSFAVGLEVIRHLNLAGGVDKYLNIAHYLHRHKLLRKVLFISAGMRNFTAKAVDQMRPQLKNWPEFLEAPNLKHLIGD